MPVFEKVTTLACPVDRVFAFLADPANLIRVSPPEFHLKLVDGPARLHPGARVTVQGRRWGVSQKILSEITAFEPPYRLVDEQREGPFGKFVHTHQMEPTPDGGTRMTDRIEFEPPGGLLGLVLSAARIRHDLENVFAQREAKFKEFLEG